MDVMSSLLKQPLIITPITNHTSHTMPDINFSGIRDTFKKTFPSQGSKHVVRNAKELADVLQGLLFNPGNIDSVNVENATSTDDFQVKF